MEEIIVISRTKGKAKKRVFNVKKAQVWFFFHSYLFGELQKLGLVVEEINIKYK